MISKTDFAAIAALDFSAIKAKLMHKAGKGWTQERVNAVECEYRRFLFLMKVFPNEPTAPLVDVDTFWHYHILDTMKYAQDCQKVFGYFLHHFPYVGMRGEEDEAALQRMGERMRTIYEATFDETYPGSEPGRQLQPRTAFTARIPARPAYCGAAVAAEPAYCGASVKAEPAYCGATSAAPAYCGAAVSAAPAYCGAAVAMPSVRAKRQTEYLPDFYTLRPTIE
jgi:hypothetical protein